MASTENIAVLHGWPQASISGVTDGSTNPRIPRVEDFNDYPKRVARAVAMLLRNGIGGPFGLAMRPGHYLAVMAFTERGGDFLFESGQDLSMGYSHHDADSVHLYLEESFSFRVATKILGHRLDGSETTGAHRPAVDASFFCSFCDFRGRIL